MQKIDYIYMINDNIIVFQITLPSDLQGNRLHGHLDNYDEKNLKIIAGFDKNFLEHFLILSKGKSQGDLVDVLKKMEKISYMIGPTGNLNYLGSAQIQYILTKLGSLKLKEIKEDEISKIADEQIEKEFGTPQGSASALENQLSSAAFYLHQIGYSNQEIQEKFKEVRRDPSKVDALFTLQPKEIFNIPPEIQQRSMPPSSTTSQQSSTSIDNSQATQNAIDHHVQSIQHEVTGERAKKVDEIMILIKNHTRESMTENFERVLRQMHPDRLNKALRMLRTTKRKSKRMTLYLEWFFSSTLLSKIEIKVEHWQVSSQAGRGTTGVYTAGIDFSRYDNIVREFSDGKLTKVINVSRRILQSPTKNAIQKLGQDLIAETGFDEHLYFTD
ncbi:hypothetical protein LCGC14_1910970 [marine sediment metagenome]|uniref:Uncharacterized protein n=1 Tax=marine sediment metagenome TaxID=412755 RepID=A0A0F9IRP9_9ZZZZ